jgi:hypothetical protein
VDNLDVDNFGVFLHKKSHNNLKEKRIWCAEKSSMHVKVALNLIKYMENKKLIASAGVH